MTAMTTFVKTTLKKIRNASAAIAVAFLALPVAVYAAGPDLGLSYATATGLTTTDIRTVIARIISYFLGLLGLIALLLILYAGFTWMTAGGNEEKVSQAKRILTQAVIGLVIIMSAFAITQFVIGAITEGTLGGNTSNSGCTTPGGCCPAGQICSGLSGGGGFNVTGITPAGAGPGNGGWPKNSSLSVNFNANVNMASATSTNVQVFKCNPRLVNGAASPFNYNSCNTPVAGTITAGGSGNRIDFQPTGTPGPNPTDFEADFWYKISVQGQAVTSQAGDPLQCPLFTSDISLPTALNSYCARAVAFNDKRDTQPPTVTIGSPVSPPPYCASSSGGSLVQVIATGNDDFMVAGVDYLLDGGSSGLTDVRGVPLSSSVNNAAALPFNSADIYADIGKLAPGMHSVSAVARDGVPQMSSTAQTQFKVNAPHCCNNVLDTAQGETGKDCGGECGSCVGGSCTATADCAAGAVCVSGKCVTQPTITSINTYSAGPGTYITIKGTGFGTIAGTVTFLGAAGDGDDKIAQACAANQGWSDTQVIVIVPAGAVDGPIKLAASTGFDATNDANGPQLPDFKITTATAPGICYLDPASGAAGTKFAINGAGFGATIGTSFVQVGSTQATVVTCGTGDTDCGWSDSRIWVTTPPIAEGDYPVTATVNGTLSNPSTYVIRPADPLARPTVTGVIPESGPVGTYVTIQGLHFGTRKGVVKFLYGSGLTAEVALSDDPVCSDNWHDNYIIVKVPAKYKSTLPVNASNAGVSHGIQVETSTPTQISNNNISFGVNLDPLRPGICSLKPDNGPAASNVTVNGEGFNGGGQTPSSPGAASSPRFSLEFYKTVGKHCLYSPATACDALALGTACPTSGQGVCVPNTLPAPLFRSWSDTTIEGVVAGITTDKATWPKTGPVYVIANNQLSANAVPFTVQDCNQAGITCPVGNQCCSNGACQTSCVPAAKTSAYGWQFSTSVLPALPYVIERAQCDIDAKLFQSPSPAHDSQDACKNAQAYFEFSRPLDTSTISNSTVKADKCGTGDTPDCTTPVSVAMTIGQSSFTGCDALNPANCTGFQTQPSPGYNGGFWEKKAWYRVTLVSNPATGIGLREPGPTGKFLDGDLDKKQGGNYVTMFRVRDSDDPCQIANVLVAASRQLIADDQNPIGFNANPIAANCNVLTCDDNQYNISWIAVPAYLTTNIAPMSQPTSQCTRKALALKETPPGLTTPFTATMSSKPSGPPKSGQSDVTVKFADPKVIAVSPTNGCTQACINAAITATFNVPMNAASLSASNVQVQICRNDTCAPPYLPLPNGFTYTTSLSPDGFKLTVNKSMDFAVNTSYIVRILGDNPATPAIEGAYSLSGVPLSGLNDGQSFSWKFRTKNDPSRCAVASTKLEPKSAILRFVGDREDLTGTGYGSADACNPDGQELDTSTTNWLWTFDNPNLVLQGFVHGDDLAGPYQFWKPEVKATQSTVVDTKPHPVLGCSSSCLYSGSQDSLPACGDGIVDSKFEACDLGPANGTGPCNKNCTWRGNTAANGCGDGNVDPTKGEECDMISGVFPPGCKKPDVVDPNGIFATNIGCIMTGASTVPGTQCGNGLIGDGEECDDGSLSNGDGCNSDCLLEGSRPSCVIDPTNPQCIGVCGNGKLEPGEDPDCEKAGVSPSTLNCSPHTCLKNGTSACGTPNDLNCCGNGKADPGEDPACDTVNGIPLYCTTRCLLKGSSAFYDKPSFCGDGYKGAGEVASCEPTGNGDGNTDGYQATVANTQPGFDATNPAGSMSTVKGSIAGVSDAKSGRSQITLSCTCKNEPVNSQDTFCANLRPDLACADNGCCMPRPTVERVEPTTFNSCRNALVTMVFSEVMDDSSVTKNFMIGFGNGNDACPQGTVEVPAAYVPQSFWVRLWQGMVNFLKDTFIRPVFGVSGNDAGYDQQKFCSVKGNAIMFVDGTGPTKKSVLTFTPSHAYPTDKYMRIRLNAGAKSARGVPLSITNTSGAGGYTAYFGTGSTICAVQKVTVNPPSILLSSVDDQQVVMANAVAAGGQAIAPTPEYAWGWSWDTYPSQPVSTAAPLVITPRVSNITACSLGAKCTAAGGCPCYIDSGSALCTVAGGADSCTGTVTETLPIADLRVRGSKAADGAYSPKNSKGQLPINAKAVIANECVLPSVCTSPSGCNCGVGPSSCTVINGATSCAVLSGSGVSVISSQTTTGTGSAVVMLCKHPWPNYHACVGQGCYTDIWEPYSPLEFPGVAFYYCRDLGKTGATSMAPGQPVADAAGGTKPAKSALLAGSTAPATTLPCLKETPASVAAPVPGILREYLFTYESNLSNCPDGPQSAGAPWLNDAFGLRVSSNEKHVSIGDWYFGRGFRGNPTPKAVDGYGALSEGRTTYVSAAFRKASSQKLYTNSYILSYSDNSAPETSAIYDQILANVDFNADPDLQNFGACRLGPSRTDAMVLCTVDNDCRVDSFGRPVPGREQYKCDAATHTGCVTDKNVAAPDAGNPVACGTDYDCLVGAGGTSLNRPATVTCDVPKAKLTRDVKRWSDLLSLRDSLVAKATETGSFPKLDAGTFLRAQTNSTWPSWGDAFAKGVGGTVPNDPVNQHAVCAGPNQPYDPKTCWDANRRQYVCPQGSHVYEYQSFGGVDFWLRNDFEYDVLGDSWAGGTCLDKTDLASCIADPMCGGTCSNNKAQSCTDSGDCNGGTCQVPCNFRLGKVIFGAGNSASCQGVPISPTSGGSCGDGILQDNQSDPAKNEVCEIRMTQSQACNSDPAKLVQKQGAYTQTCNSQCNGWVTQGVCTASSQRAGFICVTSADCGTGGSCITWTDFRCNGEAGNAKNGAACVKDSDCTDGAKKGVCASACQGGRCGDGAVQAPEQCDDGALNGTYGHCKADCTAVGFSCGDSLRQPNEACDCGGANGQYAFNGIKAAASNTNAPNQCLQNPAGFNVYSCSWDCSGAGPRCGDGIVNGTAEKCDGGFEEFKGFCNDAAQTGCNATANCPAIGTCVGGKCSNGDNVSCVSNSDCVGSCGHFCPTVEQKQRHSCNPNNPATIADDATACTWSAWTCTSPGTCGNGKKETGEQCDDGNTDNTDSCIIDTSLNYTCKASICGDGYVNPGAGEECDTGSSNGRPCIPKYGITCNYCNGNCRVATVSGAYCGDNAIQDSTTVPVGPEQCDGVKGLGDDWVCVSNKEENRSFGLITGPGGCSNQTCQRACADPNSSACNNTGGNTDSDQCPPGAAKSWCDSRKALSDKAYTSVSSSFNLTFLKSNTTPAGLNDSCDPDDDNDGVPDSLDCDPKNANAHPSYQIPPHDGLGAVLIPAAPEVCDGIDNDCDGKIDNLLSLSGQMVDAQTDKKLPGASIQFFCGPNLVYEFQDNQIDGNGNFNVNNAAIDSSLCAGVTQIDYKIVYGGGLCGDAGGSFPYTPGGCYGWILPKRYVTKKPAPGDVRAILTWGANPRDVDFHLFANHDKPNNHLWFSAGGGNGSNIRAQVNDDAGLYTLDHDSTTGLGPETISLHPKDTSTIYRFVAHRFSGSGDLLASPIRIIAYAVSKLDNSCMESVWNAPIYTGYNPVSDDVCVFQVQGDKVGNWAGHADWPFFACPHDTTHNMLFIKPGTNGNDDTDGDAPKFDY